MPSYPQNASKAVDIVRLLKNSHQARGCTSQFLLSASNPEVLELANKDLWEGWIAQNAQHSKKKIQPGDLAGDLHGYRESACGRLRQADRISASAQGVQS